jgi:hypothetical protein
MLGKIKSIFMSDKQKEEKKSVESVSIEMTAHDAKSLEGLANFLYTTRPMEEVEVGVNYLRGLLNRINNANV